jgi:hypothetical protein
MSKENKFKYLNQNFRRDLEKLISSYSLENDSNIPDWLIAQYLLNCLLGMNLLIIGYNTFYEK